jgi:hypothetical protein
MTENIGPRLAGSRQAEAAVSHVADEVRRYSAARWRAAEPVYEYDHVGGFRGGAGAARAHGDPGNQSLSDRAERPTN